LTNDDRLHDLFEQATELSPGERVQFLASACGDDRALLEELHGLLAADAAAMEDESWQRSAIRNQAIAEKHSADSAVGEIVGNYRLVELVGSGGMGSVYRAVRVDNEIEMSVAVKLIRAAFYSPDVIAKFRAERQILANLQHPNIARVLDGGARADGLPYLIMEFVDGVPPGDYCGQHDLAINQRLGLFRQVCSAVHYAHQNMVIHRDLKPANILVTSEGTAKLLDFGVAEILSPDPSQQSAAATEALMARMTVRYSSPEQVRGEQVTTASDVYSLGVILYELLTGRSPYGDIHRAPHQIMQAVCEEEPARPSAAAPKLKGDLDNIILRALRKSPVERYASVAQFSDDIGRYLEGRPVQARGDAPLYLGAKFVKRNLVMVLAATIVLCSLIGGLVEVALARARAERRFNELRQLAHSVMFNYADALDSLPGSTPVRAQMVKDALNYLDNLSKEADNPQLQREIVDAYARVSNVQGNEYQNNLGDPEGGLTSARKAGAAAEKLLREDRTPPALNSAAGAFSTFGDLLFSTGDLAAADQAYQRTISLREEITAKSPKDLDNSLALSTDLKKMGDLYGGYGWPNLGKTAESLAYYQEANALATKLVAQFPGNVDVAKTSYKALMSLSSSETTMGMRNEAAKDLSETLRQIDKVRAELPGDAHVEVELANTESRLGQMLLDDRNAAGAIPHLSHAVDLMRNLLNTDSGNAIYRRREAIMQSQWAAALRCAGRISEAISHNERALSLAQALYHDAPGSAEYRANVGVIERNVAEGLLAVGDAAAALDHVTQAEIILCKNAPAPVDPYTQANCGRSLLAAGNSQLALNEPSDAVQSFREAEKIASMRSQIEPLNAIFRSDWARSEAALAAGLAKVADDPSASAMYEAALKNWSLLRNANSLSAEDAHRAEEATRAFAALGSRR
jgi:tetratricopeptide (TPR) repeat protein